MLREDIGQLLQGLHHNTPAIPSPPDHSNWEGGPTRRHYIAEAVHGDLAVAHEITGLERERYTS